MSTPVHHARVRDPDDLLLDHLAPAQGRDIIWRMLRNLEEIYRSQSDTTRLALVRARMDIMREARQSH